MDLPKVSQQLSSVSLSTPVRELFLVSRNGRNTVSRVLFRQRELTEFAPIRPNSLS